MTLWKSGDPYFSEVEKTATDLREGKTYRRIARSWFEPEEECERTEDLYQLIIADQVVRQELHQRSPATRSYTQDQARDLFKKAGFKDIELYSEFTFEPVKKTDTLFTVVAKKETSG
jgi:hypothetical protein